MSLASKLKALRVRDNQSLQQVADAVGVSKAHIWEMEAGNSTNPGLELLRKLADHFKVTVSHLANDDETPEDAVAVQFFREYEGKLSAQDWDVIRNLAAHLKKPK